MTAAPASNPELPAARKLRRRWPGRLLWFAVLGAGAAGLLWAAAAWWLPARKTGDVLTAAATRGELVITVTDRGELESSQSVEVVCEVEGGAKVAKIVTEGTRVKKGDEVVRFDPDSLLKLINGYAEKRLLLPRSLTDLCESIGEFMVAEEDGHVVASGARFGISGVRDFAPDRWLEEGDKVSIGELTFDILHCPGHSPGSVVFFNKELRFAHVGDVLFNGSVGRTDLPGGSHATLISSIKEKLLPLGDDVGFICGHGAGSSIGQERLTNPFLTGEM